MLFCYLGCLKFCYGHAYCLDELCLCLMCFCLFILVGYDGLCWVVLFCELLVNVGIWVDWLVVMVLD